MNAPKVTLCLDQCDAIKISDPQHVPMPTAGIVTDDFIFVHVGEGLALWTHHVGALLRLSDALRQAARRLEDFRDAPIKAVLS